MSSTQIPSAQSPAFDWPHTWLSRICRQFFHRLAGMLSWVWMALIAVVVINVTMRYVLGEGRIEFEEIQWHLYATGFMLGMATCMDSDQHVRVDVLHDRASQRTRAWIELYGLLLLFLPFVLAMLIFSLPFVSYSFSIGEVSDAPGGLPGRWLIKGVLTLAMAMLLLAGISRLSRILAFLLGWPNRVG